MARLAVAILVYHPLVCWMAGRLQLQQELAADAVGARFARGRGPYLLALSRLCLSREDGQSPMLAGEDVPPARGTLIRRITMLRDNSEAVERPWSRCFAGSWRVCVYSGRGQRDDTPRPGPWCRRQALGRGTVPAARVRDRDTGRHSTALSYVEPSQSPPHASQVLPARGLSSSSTSLRTGPTPENMVGMVAFRPAATFRRAGMARFATRIREAVVLALSDDLKTRVKVDVWNLGRMTTGPRTSNG